MGYDSSTQGLTELFCQGCGKSIGFHPYAGFKTVSECGMCLAGDGFVPPPEWPNEGPFLGREVGTTLEDIAKMGHRPTSADDKPQPRKKKTEEVPTIESEVKRKTGKRKWMSRE